MLLTRVRTVESSHIGDLIRIADQTNLNPWSAASYFEELKNPHSLIFRLETEANDSIGFIVGRVVPAADSETAVDAEIYNIGVDPVCQRQGMGQVLLDTFTNACVERNVRFIWLEVRETNMPALTIYSKNGFEAVTIRKDFYKDPRENAILMRRTLSTETGLK